MVSSTQLLPEAMEGALTRVSLQVNAEADTRALVRALHAIGNARPLLRIDRLVVRDPYGVFAMSRLDDGARAEGALPKCERPEGGRRPR